MPAPVRLNSYRIEGSVAFVDISTRANPGIVTTVDAVDLPLVLDARGRWYAYKHPNRPMIYAMRMITVGPGRQAYQLMHRFLAKTKRAPVVIHLDHNGLNNRRQNLKATTRGGQAAHARHAKAKFRGVFRRGSGSCRAIIGVGGRLLRLGTFKSDIEAARAYDAAARKHFGALARLNFPDN